MVFVQQLLNHGTQAGSAPLSTRGRELAVAKNNHKNISPEIVSNAVLSLPGRCPRSST